MVAGSPEICAISAATVLASSRRFGFSTPAMKSSTEALVTMASVRSGMISETAPTNVVLPAPNPPEMTIFVDAGACRSECP